MAAARVQDERWERGRFSLMGHALAAGVTAAAHGRFAAAAGAGEVAALPLSMLVGIAGACAVATVAGVGSVPLTLIAGGSLVAYVTTGLVAARVSPRDAAALLAAPRFLAYKAGSYARVVGKRRTGWKRTERPDDGLGGESPAG